MCVGRRSQHLHLGRRAQGPVDDRLRQLLLGTGQRDEDPIDVVCDAQGLEVVGSAEDGDAANGPADEVDVVIDEGHDVDVAAGLRVGELVGERGARAPRPDDQRPDGLVVAGALPLEREEPRLEAHATATEEDQQRGRRRSGEHGQIHVGGLRRDDRATAPQMPVPAATAAMVRNPSSTEAYRQTGPYRPAARLTTIWMTTGRPSSSRAWRCTSAGMSASKPGGIGEQPGDRDDAGVEQHQAEVVGVLGPPVHGARYVETGVPI